MATGADFVSEASRFIGTPYVWGGANPRGFDCSGLVQYSLERLGLQNVPRTSEDQWAWVDRVQAENVEPGDLVFMHFPGEQGAGHVAIFAGASGKGPSRRSYVIQAPKPGGDVQRVPFSPLPAGSSEWGGRIVGYGRVPGLSYKNVTLESLWLHAGGPAKVARTMAAIALAESGGRVNAKGGPNSDGSYDYGLWQINSSHGYNVFRLTHDPGYNARAAVAVYHSQGLQAWTTYTSGRYKAFLGNAATATPASRPPRPDAGGTGGGSGGGGGGGDAGTTHADAAAASAAQAAAWGSYMDEGATPGVSLAGAGVQPASLNLNPLPFGPSLSIPGTGWIPNIPGVPDPFKIFGEASSAVSDLGTFLKWIAWLFSPRNILRIVEFLAGAGLMAIGLYFAGQAAHGSSSSGPVEKKSSVKRAAGTALTLAAPETKIGRAVIGAKGKRAAGQARKRTATAERRKTHAAAVKRSTKRELAKRGPGESRRAARGRRKAEEGDIPF